ncbi:2-amino-4-hydroxy-6-hydroxymethyldihydropteridine diphosphokinase [Herbiconiux daphne]|uniref:2-amino-4-hydroxy-6-hydroxymethyldihydropteridine diphosphokinase n=1 Tax=Herbiconiux daphne TaxID=2970914 RepID=A0ABT2GWK2_9MICO|nr:2-amino-4-hydroxy-6-hydroxymethyldihydropteridine diphosphokinase [Herbiconiux daphne]MCS5732345.1 2-amino-4-hydroxy-6-hydroxymethyldihydropteridine diphosphokinase [Herbiconiux daphne]
MNGRPIPSVDRRFIRLPAVLAFGSNLGDREGTIRAALDDLRATDGIEVVSVSRLYQTAAVKPDGIDHDAPVYLNAVALIRTSLQPEQLLEAVNRIEHEHGRVRAERWGDRTLDIDIVAFASIVRDTERLTLPHPRAAERDFVLVPWLEIDPDATLQGYGRADQLLAAIPQSTLRIYAGESR